MQYKWIGCFIISLLNTDAQNYDTHGIVRTGVVYSREDTLSLCIHTVVVGTLYDIGVSLWTGVTMGLLSVVIIPVLFSELPYLLFNDYFCNVILPEFQGLFIKKW